MQYNVFTFYKVIMALSPQKSREHLFQLLYSWDLNPEPLQDSCASCSWAEIMQRELRLSAHELASLKARACAIIAHYPMLDPLLAEQSTSYEFVRIQSVEKTILRLALYELMIERSIPSKVAIAEAIRLSRKFSTAEAAHFINAILDALYKKQK